jgi:hypothetical protein
MYRLYIDEVGTDDLGDVNSDNGRYLSLTGVAMLVQEARDVLSPEFARMKADIFDHDPDEPIIFHRKKIVKFGGPFVILKNDSKRETFDADILAAMGNCQYAVITALIDKKAMLAKTQWTNKEPYHYLMEVIVEKYVQFLERKNAIGDIMPEGRMGKQDERLQSAFLRVMGNGTYYVSRDRMRNRVPSSNLKFRYKRDNIAGLQLADLIAHPSHFVVRERMQHQVTIGTFCAKVKELLNSSKYDRADNGTIKGYGVKWLP